MSLGRSKEVDLSKKALIYSWFQVLGIVASSLALITALFFLIWSVRYVVLPLLIFLTININLQVLAIVGYVFFSQVRMAEVLVWLGLLSLLTLFFTSIGSEAIVYLVALLLASVSVLSNLNKNNRSKDPAQDPEDIAE